MKITDDELSRGENDNVVLIGIRLRSCRLVRVARRCLPVYRVSYGRLRNATLSKKKKQVAKAHSATDQNFNLYLNAYFKL